MFKGGGDMTKINSHPTQQKEAQLLDVVTHFYVKKIFRGETNFNGSPSYSHSCNVLYKVQKYWTKNSPVDPEHFLWIIFCPPGSLLIWFRHQKKVSSILCTP